MCIRSAISGILAASVLACGPLSAAVPAANESQQVVLAGTSQTDFVSEITGRTYRIYLAVPEAPPPPTGYPVMFVTDGDINFMPAVIQSRLQRSEGIPAAVVVGVGYPEGSGPAADRLNRRNLDFTLPTAPGHVPPGLKAAWENKLTGFGDAEAFFRVVTEEVRPLVSARAQLDPARQALFGHSLGGLFTVGALRNHHYAFAAYIASSPSLWWNGNQAIKPSLLQGIPSKGRLLVTVGALEQSAQGVLLPPGPQREITRLGNSPAFSNRAMCCGEYRTSSLS